MMAGGNQPIPGNPLDQPARCELPAHVIGDAHYRHYRKNDEQGSNMNGNDEDESWNNNRSRQRFKRVEAHCRPGRWRSAGVVNGMSGPEQSGPMHPAMSPIKPGVVQQQIDHY